MNLTHKPKERHTNRGDSLLRWQLQQKERRIAGSISTRDKSLKVGSDQREMAAEYKGLSFSRSAPKGLCTATAANTDCC